MVPLGSFHGQVNHLVPSLLPDNIPRIPAPSDKPLTIIHIALFTGVELLQGNFVEGKYLKSRCNLPAGVFEQVRCRYSFFYERSDLVPFYSICSF